MTETSVTDLDANILVAGNMRIAQQGDLFDGLFQPRQIDGAAADAAPLEQLASGKQVRLSDRHLLQQQDEEMEQIAAQKAVFTLDADAPESDVVITGNTVIFQHTAIRFPPWKRKCPIWKPNSADKSPICKMH